MNQPSVKRIPIKRIPIKQIKEIIIVSDDVEASRHLYRDILGLPMPEVADQLNMAAVGPQFFGTARVGVIKGVTPPGRVHFGFEVEYADFEPSVELLRSQGVDVETSSQRPGWMDTPESVGAYFHDPDGNLLELWAALPAADACGSTPT